MTAWAWALDQIVSTTQIIPYTITILWPMSLKDVQHIKTFADALSDGINALGEGLFALLMGEVFGIGLKLKETHKGV